MTADIHFLSREAATLFEPTGEYPVIISITDPGEQQADLEPGWFDVLRLEFHDIDGRFGDFRLFSQADAGSVVSFLDKHREADQVVVHCRYGQSRSAAVALYVAHRQLSWLDRRAEAYNPLVWRMLIRAEALRALKKGQLLRLASTAGALIDGPPLQL